jgi:hypothetical protein
LLIGALKAANSYLLITNNFILFLKENKQIWVCVVKEEHVMLTNQDRKSQP